MSDPEKKLSAVAAFMATLTPKGVALLIVLGISAAIGYAVWEQRTTLLPVYLNSTAALTGTVVVFVFILLGLLLTDLYGRLEERAERIMKTHTDSLQAQITLQAATILDQSGRIAALLTEHTACQKQVAELAILIARLQHAKGSDHAKGTSTD